VILVSSISNFFTTKTSLANKWMSFSSSNLALGKGQKISNAIFFILQFSQKTNEKNCPYFSDLTHREEPDKICCSFILKELLMRFYDLYLLAISRGLLSKIYIRQIVKI